MGPWWSCVPVSMLRPPGNCRSLSLSDAVNTCSVLLVLVLISLIKVKFSSSKHKQHKKDIIVVFWKVSCWRQNTKCWVRLQGGMLISAVNLVSLHLASWCPADVPQPGVMWLYTSVIKCVVERTQWKINCPHPYCRRPSRRSLRGWIFGATNRRLPLSTSWAQDKHHLLCRI